MNDLISRQSVITMLQKIENAVEDGDGFQFNEWIDYAKDIPSAEKTTITDTDSISRQAVKDLIRKFKKQFVQSQDEKYFDYVIAGVELLPSAEKTDGDLKSEIDKLPRIKVGNSNSPTVKYCIDEVLLYDLLEHYKAENTANKININDFVKVKLTDYGKEIFYHQYDNLNRTYGKEIIKPSYPTVDSDGYTSFQLWCFINLYGRYIDMGVQNVIEPLEIVFESAEKTAECDNSHDCEHCDWTECPLEVEKETDGDLIRRNDVIKMFNIMDRYKADKLILQDTYRIFPSNEVFIVDDCYELLEQLPTYSAEQTENPTKDIYSAIEYWKSVDEDNQMVKWLTELQEYRKAEREKAEQTYDWCKGCKEYDTEKHCCHRYSSFIRESLQENINAVLEDIKTEIEKEQYECPYPLDIEHAIDIIEKHISGKENNGKTKIQS